MAAGRLDQHLTFERRRNQSDGHGNTVSVWEGQFTLAAERMWLRGGENVMAARLESRQPVILKVRNSVTARQIGNDWRAVDERDGRIYNIQEVPKESDNRAYLEMLAESGIAS